MRSVSQLTQSSLVAPPILQRGYQQRAHADNAAVEEVSHQPLPFLIFIRSRNCRRGPMHEHASITRNPPLTIPCLGCSSSAPLSPIHSACSQSMMRLDETPTTLNHSVRACRFLLDKHETKSRHSSSRVRTIDLLDMISPSIWTTHCHHF